MTAALILLAVASCTARKERQARQKELLAQVAKQNEENSHPSIPDRITAPVLNDKVTVEFRNVERAVGGMVNFVLTVSNNSDTPIKKTEGQGLIKSDFGLQWQLGWDIPMKLPPRSTLEYRMLVEPRWEKADSVSSAKFWVTSVEPDF